MTEGRIIKALSGFYYVQSGDNIYACKGRGLFRKKKISPLVGDFVEFDKSEHMEGYITKIKTRKNALSRPPIANIDQAVIVSAAKMPDFQSLLLDRFLILVEAKQIKPIIFITKMDLLSSNEKTEIESYKNDYESNGYDVELISSHESSDLTHLIHYFDNKVSVMAGQSGVGKSSILNALNPSLSMKAGEISSSLGRGKHTTRHVELVSVGKGLVADTPGFSSLEFDELPLTMLADCFPEMRERKEMCKYRGCLHIKEPGCEIKKALENGHIQQYRYDHYVTFFNEIESRKPRY